MGVFKLLPCLNKNRTNCLKMNTGDCFKVLSNVYSCLSREKKDDLKHWCATCHTHFTSSIPHHRRTEEHRVIGRSLYREMYFHENISRFKKKKWFGISVSHQLASRTVISSCTVCKKHFRTSQIFVEHLQSPEHRQKVEEVSVCIFLIYSLYTTRKPVPVH